jgi:hypothetical protein
MIVSRQLDFLDLDLMMAEKYDVDLQEAAVYGLNERIKQAHYKKFPNLRKCNLRCPHCKRKALYMREDGTQRCSQCGTIVGV